MSSTTGPTRIGRTHANRHSRFWSHGREALEPIDAGPLRIAGYTEPFALLVGQLAYEGERGPAMAYQFEWFDPQQLQEKE